jgi:glutaminyl-peptide cyclotransferase
MTRCLSGKIPLLFTRPTGNNPIRSLFAMTTMNYLKRLKFKLLLILTLAALPSLTSPPHTMAALTGQSPAVAASRPQISKDGIPIYTFAVARTYPHDPEAFTQGLLFHDGYLYESTGLWGKSTVRQVELETGKVLRSHDLPASFFGEGLALWQDRLIQLTWKNQVALIYRKKDFSPLGHFTYPTEGWGLTGDGVHLIMSDGSSTLRFLDPDTFHIVRSIEVRSGTQSVRKINELEFIRGEIYANIWKTDYIARISPDTGQVVGWIDLRGLLPEEDRTARTAELNGIAWDAGNDRLFVTGKRWPKLFEIRLVPVGSHPGQF